MAAVLVEADTGVRARGRRLDAGFCDVHNQYTALAVAGNAARLMADADDETADTDGWFERMMNVPKFKADYERSMNKCDVEDAAGFEGYTTEEVFADLKKEFPHLWESPNGQ